LSTAFQPDIAALLERAGARPRGNRHDCPQCGGRRTVTHGAEVFFCHKCGWKGNSITLERALGLRRQWIPSAEYIRRQRQRERANEAARALYERVKARRFALYDELRTLGRIEAGAHARGPTEVAWDGLALVYRGRPMILAELGILDNAGAADLVRFLNSTTSERESACAGVLDRGGIYAAGKFIEVAG